jgi:DNA-binding transcriptional ArsR family regulator
MPIELLRPVTAAASRILKAMGNPHRLTVLCDLAYGELSVKELEVRLGLSQSALSQHLARLRQEKLVRTRRHRQTIYYSLNGEAAERVMLALVELYRPNGVNGEVAATQDLPRVESP